MTLDTDGVREKAIEALEQAASHADYIPRTEAAPVFAAIGDAFARIYAADVHRYKN